MKQLGTLCPLSALPGAYGIGTLGKNAVRFLDYLERGGKRIWQILPVGLADGKNSPYQSVSAYAGNPWYIDPDVLGEKGLLNAGDLETTRAYFSARNTGGADYEGLRNTRAALLLKAYRAWCGSGDEEAYREWLTRSEDWAAPYAQFQALSGCYNGAQWSDWDDWARTRSGDRYESFLDTTVEERGFYLWQQYEFDSEFAALKAEAARRGVRILGDMPIYVSFNSVEVWSEPELFQIDGGKMTAVAGVPPDYFSKKGQIWGSPLYRFDVQEKTNFDWWVRRMRRATELFDLVRIDHFRAFASYYSVPFGDGDACGGHWEHGAGLPLFSALEQAFGAHLPVIAEDLGTIDGDVRTLLKETGFPGMKVLQFAFDGNPENEYLPSRHIPDCVVYTGTHDNDTTRGWLESMSRETFDRTRAILIDDLSRLNKSGHEMRTVFSAPESAACPDFVGAGAVQDSETLPTAKEVRALFELVMTAARSSIADTVIFPIADELYLGNSARINTPATTVGNWTWRLSAIPSAAEKQA